LVIVAFWVFVPLFAFGFTYFVSKLFSYFKIEIKSSKKQKILGIVLLVAGFFEAFSAGMNNVANAVGPLVAAGVLDVAKGTLYGG
ncbi:inorganic phosphate transporter, partial [Bacillus inaquosorum]|nr:inorganic phosphate transporter [Bacillus inaquosorum]